MKRFFVFCLALFVLLAGTAAVGEAYAEPAAFRSLVNSEGSVNYHFALGIDENGTAWQFQCWAMDLRYVKAQPVDCGGTRIVQVAGNGDGAYALDEAGNVWTWKVNLFQDPVPEIIFSGARAMDVAYKEVFLLTTDGKLFYKGWFSPHGYPADQQRGSDTEDAVFDTFTEYENTRGMEIRDVVVQRNGGILRCGDGSQWAWNYSRLYGLQELGRRELYDETAALQNFEYLYFGDDLTYAITPEGTLYAAGDTKVCIGDSSIQGGTQERPASWDFHAIRPDTAFMKARKCTGFSLSNLSSAAIDRNGNVWAWGNAPALFGELPDAAQLTSGKAYTDFAFVGEPGSDCFLMLLDAEGRLEVRGGNYGNEFVPYNPENPVESIDPQLRSAFGY